MHVILMIITVLTFVLGLGVFRVSIPLASRWGLVDIPTARRRHPHPTPVIGGLCVLFVWSLAIAFYALVQPDWYVQVSSSLLPLCCSLFLLLVAGIIDDIKGLKPIGKLAFQISAGLITLVYEPRVHSFCNHWTQTLGMFAWPLALLWLVGLSNAVNLVDGMDGLAGGISFLVTGSLVSLSSKWGLQGDFAFVIMTLLMGSLASFIFYNWHPAKVFLGDNGSLPMGFLIATTSLTGPNTENSWVQVISIILMMGYPILDMGLCTLRRFRHKNPIFKADRAHLHHRLRRFGLSVPQVTILILSITFYLQLSSLCINFMSMKIGLIYMGAICLSLFSLLFLMRSIEQRRVERMSSSASIVGIGGGRDARVHLKECLVAKIDLEPLFEAGMFEEKERLHEIIQSLQLMLKTMVRKNDNIFLIKHTVHILFIHEAFDKESIVGLKKILQEKLAMFQTVYNLQYSLADLPVKFERQHFLIQNEVAIVQADQKNAA